VAGGTVLTLAGTLLNRNALVEFLERDAAGVVTGARAECAWRGVPGMDCNDTVVTCVAPPCAGAGRYFDVTLSVGGVPAAFLGFRFEYDPPVVAWVQPNVLAPHPGPLTPNLTIVGANFGFVGGRVTLGRRALACPVWTNTRLVCAPVPGVVAGHVVVSAASTQTSAPTPVSRVQFEAPVVVEVRSGAGDPSPGEASQPSAPHGVTSGTRGGVLLVVVGASFAVPVLPMALWLVKGGGGPSLPQAGAAWPPTDVQGALLRCPLVLPSELNSTTTSTRNGSLLWCTLPPGTGAGWRVVAVNHDVDVVEGQGQGSGGVSPTLWQSSSPSDFVVNYAPPVVHSVAVVVAAPGASAGSSPAPPGHKPAAGGFRVRLVGANFGPMAPQVLVGDLPCQVVTGSFSHESLDCVAPPRQVYRDASIVVVQDGLSSAAVAFAYDAPLIAAVEPSEFDAVLPGGTSTGSGGIRPRLSIKGINFGE
jgi:hypothetical protein